jgi:hypothetical protein
LTSTSTEPSSVAILAHHPPHLPQVRVVARPRRGAAALTGDELRRLFRALAVEIEHGDVRAVFAEPQRDATPDHPAAAGNQANLAFEPLHRERNYHSSKPTRCS